MPNARLASEDGGVGLVEQSVELVGREGFGKEESLPPVAADGPEHVELVLLLPTRPIGVLLLGDQARAGFGLVAVAGLMLTLAAALSLTLRRERPAPVFATADA